MPPKVRAVRIKDVSPWLSELTADLVEESPIAGA
jgi:hypothetical protein